jgi:acyl-CoA thioesterase-1
MLARRRLLALLVLLPAAALLAGAGLYADPAAWHKALSPASRKDPAFTFVKADPKLPNVLLIGDSISIGYTPAVRQALAGKANVYRIPANGADTARGLKNLDAWLGGVKWAVIHFNFGLHDLKYVTPDGKYDLQKGKVVATPEQYAKNLAELIRRLQAGGARLVFATTTPVPTTTYGRIQGSEEKYNAAALRVMQANQIQVNDLCALVRPNLAKWQLPKNVHFSAEGYRRLGAQTAAEIEKALAATSTRRP